MGGLIIGCPKGAPGGRGGAGAPVIPAIIGGALTMPIAVGMPPCCNIKPCPACAPKADAPAIGSPIVTAWGGKIPGIAIPGILCPMTPAFIGTLTAGNILWAKWPGVDAGVAWPELIGDTIEVLGGWYFRSFALCSSYNSRECFLLQIQQNLGI